MKANTPLIILMLTGTLTACSQGYDNMQDRTDSPCGDKPNCVSTQDNREQHHLESFQLTESATLEAIERVALSQPRTTTVEKGTHYLHIESKSKIMRFTDDLELKIVDGFLQVRSESRLGHSDFGVNRKRAEQLRQDLRQANLIK
ncbi:hypothetical protein BCU68_06625 [Vibrio sp. 10N.286.49.B3]|uniref:DUF1499 domain-containing protein n=1 Tax=Vibrio sp. 10N.286.49.B3 TaxID=1880855 RepID=UPI000C847201|nr:DUF1499 domain-containing protein [Vibrio sp. 10N.286.49.B3]PMH39770.1 hypothetical protein BCU68_06625 [Vibrio sp. 10N.286.49.B3]